ncbi:MAG: hypothetical protein L0Z53_06800 [Acidobacteriales bacterium]|nr:hypothetical protein [Terriglobales bacterium]
MAFGATTYADPAAARSNFLNRLRERGFSSAYLAVLGGMDELNAAVLLSILEDGTPAIGASGTPLTQIRVYSQSITPASVAAATAAEQTFTITGLATTDKVAMNPAATGNATGVCSCRVTAANTIGITFVNPTAGALTPGAGTYTFIAFRS